jgi:hypothetical protein
MGGWGCPHEVRGECQRVLGRACEPGMKGCVLAGRFLFSEPTKNTPRVLREKDGSQGPREPDPGRKRHRQ